VKVRSRLTYANVMSTIAVFGVLAGGGAYAASKIGADDIAKNAVRSKHIKQRQVKAGDLAKAALPLRSGSVSNPTDEPKTLVNLPRIGRFVTTCSFMASGNTGIRFQNRSGKQLRVGAAFATNDDLGPGFIRQLLANGDEQPLFTGTGGGSTSRTAWFSIVPAGSASRPQVQGTATIQHGCGKTTVHVLSTGP
jgi:hypothetical protein